MPHFERSTSRVAPQPGAPLLRTLGWSIAVVFVGGVIAVATTLGTTGRTVLQQGAGAITPVEQVDSGAAPGPPADPEPTAAASTIAPSTSGAPATSTSAAPKGDRAASATTVTTKAAAPAAGGTVKAAVATRVQPDAGSYPLRIEGTSSVDGKPATVPASGTLVVESRGSDQQHRTVGVPGGLVLVQRASPAGVDLVSFSLTAGSKTLTFRPPAPLAFVRTEPGASWSWSARSTDGTVGLSQTASVTGTGSVLVGGSSVPTVNVQRVFTVTGALQGTVRLTSSVSQVDRLPLIQQQVIDVKATVLGLLSTRVVSNATATVTSTSPR